MLEWLTSSEVKQRLNISHDSLVKIVLDGELKAYAPGEGNTPLVIPKQSWNQSEECRAAYLMNNADFGIDLWEYRNKRTEENESDIFCIIEQCAYNNLAPIDLSNYCNNPEPAPPIKRNCIDEFKILFLRDKDLFYDEYGNVNERFQSLVSITTNEAAHPAIRRLAISEILSELKFQKTDIEANDTETTPAPQTIPLSKEEAEEFIRSMAISYLSDTEVIIKTKNKEVTTSHEDMGFKASSRPWEMFIKMLQDPKHEHHIVIYDKNKNTESLRAYNRENKLFPSFNKKFVPFINDRFSVTLPNDFNVFKNMKHIERDGTYKPKFQIFDHRELRQQKDIKSMSKEDTLKSLKDLAIQLKRAKKEPEKELLLKEILNIGQHAKRNRWITKNHEIWDLISPSDDTPSDNDIMALIKEETEIEKLF